MANLSNINNVLRVSSDLRVGINTDAASYALEIGGTNSGIKLKNSGGSGKVYSILSDTSGNFQIYDDAAASGRLVINDIGNATFAGELSIASFIRHTGDTNTYIGFPSDDTIKLVTASNEIIRIDSSGNINVGEGTNPKGNILMGNTVVNPASGFADQTGIGLKNSATVPELQVSSDSIAMQLGRTTTGGDGQILALRKAGTIIHNFDTNNVSIGTNATFAGDVTAPYYTATNFINVKVDDAEVYWTNTANNDYWVWKRDASNNFILDHYNGSATSNALTFNSSQNATFAGNIYSGLNGMMEFRSSSYNNRQIGIDSQGFYVFNPVAVSGGRYDLKMNDSGNAIFAGNVNVGGSVSSPASVGTVLGVVGRNGIGAGTAGIVLKDYDNAAWDIWNSGGILNFRYNNGASGAGNGVNIDTTGNVSVYGRMRIFAGSNSSCLIKFGTDDSDPSNSGIGRIEYLNSDNSMRFRTNNTDRMLLDSNGNVGIGTMTIPTNGYIASGGGWKMLQIGQSSQIAAYGTDDEIAICQNTYLNSSGVFQAITSNVAGSSIILVDGKIYFKRAATSGTAQTTSTSMFIDTIGNVGIGTSSPGQKLEVYQAATNSQAYVTVQNNRSRNAAVLTQTTNGGFYTGTSIGTDTLCWQVYDASAGERMRITSGGHILFGNTSASLTSGLGFKYIDDAIAPYIGLVGNSSSSTGNTNYHYYNTNASYNGFRFYIANNGGIYNFAANNVNLSDERVKHNIENSGKYLDKICSIPVRLFNYKDEPEGTNKNLGVIAQEVEAIAPELVNNDGFGETPEDGIELKTVYSTDMMYALMKSIQELKAEIEILKNK